MEFSNTHTLVLPVTFGKDRMTPGKDRRLLERQRTLGKTRKGVLEASTPLYPAYGKTIATTQRKVKCPQGSCRKGGEDDEPIGDLRNTTLAQSTDYEFDNKGGCQCVCGKTFGTSRGMKIHRTKMGCLSMTLAQRSTPSG